MDAGGVIYTLVEVLIAVSCCIGNLLVILALWTSKSIRQPTYCLIVSLAVLHNSPLVMQLVIRQYRPSDKEIALTLFSICTREQISLCFRNAMTSRLYLAVTLALCVAGYLLGSVFGAALLPTVWVGLIYYCSYDLYDSYVRKKLRTDMQDITGNYLSRPDDCFWVAEAEVDGRIQVLGTVAVVANHNGEEKYGWLCRMMIAQQCRRLGLGRRLAQTAIDFCKEQGFSKVVLETSSTQMAAVALYSKLGFSIVASHLETESPSWIVILAKATMLRMEKRL